MAGSDQLPACWYAIAALRALVAEIAPDPSVTEAARALKIGRSTAYAALADQPN